MCIGETRRDLPFDATKEPLPTTYLPIFFAERKSLQIEGWMIKKKKADDDDASLEQLSISLDHFAAKKRSINPCKKR